MAGTVADVRERCAAAGLEAAPTEGPRSGGPAVLDGKGEADPIGLVCGPVPGGRAVWTVGMLANRSVEPGVVEGVSADAVLGYSRKRARRVAEEGRVPPVRAPAGSAYDSE